MLGWLIIDSPYTISQQPLNLSWLQVHGAIVELEGAPEALELKGYAYSGGGR